MPIPVPPSAARIATLCAIACLALAWPLRAADQPFVPGKGGWLTLFDGSDLSRWKAAKGSDWALKDNVLTGSKGEIRNYWHWVDFELVAVSRGSGALRFRASLAPMPDQPGYLLDLSDGTVRAVDAVVAKGDAGRAGSDTGWRETRLVVSKGRFTVEFDGKKVAEGPADAYPANGFLALAAHGVGGTSTSRDPRRVDTPPTPPLELKLLRARPINREKHVNVPAPDDACFVCHDNFNGETIARIHAAGRRGEDDEAHLKPASQRPRTAGCMGCHGASYDHRSDEDNVTTPDVMYTRGEVDGACLTCHTRHKAKTHRHDGEGPAPKNPVCTDCHGKHHTPS